MVLFGAAEKAKMGVNHHKFRFTSKITDIHPVVTVSTRASTAHWLIRILFYSSVSQTNICDIYLERAEGGIYSGKC